MSISTTRHSLQCAEVWSGHEAIENHASSRGLEAWVLSHPFQDEVDGGDVHYFSLCLGGLVTRIVLADVAGHGSVVAATSLRLKRLLRRFMNTKRQVQLVSEINRAFISMEADGRFVTAVVMTYLHHRRRLLITNAGHPRPLFHSKSQGSWSLLEPPRIYPNSDGSHTTDMPFGIDDSAGYSEFAQSVEDGDIVVLYTDALSEATGADDRLLGEHGLLSIARRIDATGDCPSIGHALRAAVRDFRGGESTDDESLIVIKFGEGRGTPPVAERLRAYWSTICRPFRD